MRGDELGLPENTQTSYKMPAAPEPPDVTALQPKRPPAPAAAVATIMPSDLRRRHRAAAAAAARTRRRGGPVPAG